MSMKAFSRASVMRRLFNAPHAVMPETAAIVLGAVGDRYDVGKLFVASDGRELSLPELESLAATKRSEIEARGWVDRGAKSQAAENLAYVHNGVMHVVIRGETVAENGIGPMSGFTGYDGIAAQVASGDEDPNVKGILLDIDSPGGEVSGLNELTTLLMARRGAKPMRAMIRGCGCSAAYAIAACADEITMHESGFAGSIGVIMMHADFSGSLKKDGIAVTLVTAGAHKADGNPFEPLPDDVRARFSALVEDSYSRFVAHVAAARGMEESVVRATEAQVYRGQEAVDAGLVDRIMSWSESMDDFEQQVNGAGVFAPVQPATLGARSTQETNMSDSKAPAAEAPEFNQASVDAARAEGHAEGLKAGTSAGETTERQRIEGLVEIDAQSNISPELATAISEGQSAGDFAIALAKSGKAKLGAALEGAKAGAVDPANIPEKGKEDSHQKPVNRGEAAVKRMEGKHQGLPKKAA